LTLDMPAKVPATLHIAHARSTLDSGTGEALLLYFAYTARIAPDDLVDIAPTATFEFVAHLPESTLSFAIEGNGWNGGLPTVVPEPGSTVWGAVFSIPQREMKTLDGIELAEQRHRVESDAFDRSGRRHRVSTHQATEAIGSELAPSPEYLGRMLTGSRHWELPVGWIVSLDDRLTDTLQPTSQNRAFRP
jgi:gamma-glutamylcyclotransferase (GGCT)/AIG2-like uncharacterized protein YtfP